MHYMLEIDTINNGDIQIWGAIFVWCCICVFLYKIIILKREYVTSTGNILLANVITEDEIMLDYRKFWVW